MGEDIPPGFLISASSSPILRISSARSWSCNRASQPGRRRSRQGRRNQGGEGRGGGGIRVGRRGWRAPLDPWPPCSVPSVPGTLGPPRGGAGRHSWVGGDQGGGRPSAGEASWRGRVCKAGSLWGCLHAEGGRWWGGRRGGASRCDRRRRRGLPGRKGELRSAGRSPAIRSGKICFLPQTFIPTKCPISQNGPYCLLYYFRASMFITLVRIFSRSFYSHCYNHKISQFSPFSHLEGCWQQGWG